MSHKIYTTEAIVCGSRANNTSDKSFLLFTKDAGMLWATARSVREERSRQRYALQDFSLIRVSLVRGKGGWKIGSVENDRNYFVSGDGGTRLARAAIAAIVRLLRQFLHGEIVHGTLFEDTKTALEKAQDESDGQSDLVEIFSLRLLHTLGYIAVTPELENYITTKEWWGLAPLPKTAGLAIEKAKQASHL